MLYCNLGKYYDVIYVLTEYFNCGAQYKCVDLSNVPHALFPFFCKINNNSYLQKIFKTCLDDLAQNDTIEVIAEKIFDQENTINDIINFYFPNSNCVYNTNNCKFIQNISNLIMESNYSSELKCALYSFFIDPLVITQQLLRALLDVDAQITVLYNNNQRSISQIHDDIYNGDILSKLNLNNHNKSSINYSICIINKENVEVILSEKLTYLILGQDYKRKFETTNYPDLKEFGNILTEENRIKILNLILKDGETTIKAIERTLDLSGTNTYYHISMMVRANMIITRNIGRTIYYSINKKYFTDIIKELSKYLNP